MAKQTIAEETSAAIESGRKDRMVDIAKRIAQSRPKKRANLADLGDEFFTVFRGAAGLARRAYLDFLHAPDGSPTRMRFYEITLDLAKLAAAGGSKSVEILSDDEIEDELLDLLTGQSTVDGGDPKTKEGVALAEKMMHAAEVELSPGEIAQLDAEIAELEAGSPLDEIAGHIREAKDDEPMDEVE